MEKVHNLCSMFVLQDETTQVTGIIGIINLIGMGMAHVKGFDRNYGKIMSSIMQVRTSYDLKWNNPCSQVQVHGLYKPPV